MMADVILIQPQVVSKDFHKYFPLGLLKAASFVHREYEVKVIDQTTDENWRQDLLEELQQGPLCVGITSKSGEQITYGLQISRLVKEHSDVPVVWGGVHPSLLPGQTLEDENVDIVVKGEGEITFFELVKALDKGQPLEGIEGLWYKKDGKVRSNPDRALLDLNSLPRAPYHLVDPGNYENEVIVETSRGCPYRCTFCYDNTYLKSIYREMSVERSIEEFASVLDRPGNKTLYIADDNFFINLKRSKKLLSFLKEQNKAKDLRLIIEGLRIDTALKMDKEWFDLLADAGCYELNVGAESGSQRMLDLFKKGIQASDTVTLNRRLRDIDFFISYQFIIGAPTETLQDVEATTKVALQLVKDNPKASVTPFYDFKPVPGTALYNMSIDQGFQAPKQLEDWGRGDDFDAFTHLPWLSEFEKKQFKAIQIYSGYINLSRRIPIIRYILSQSIMYSSPFLYIPLAVRGLRNALSSMGVDKHESAAPINQHRSEVVRRGEQLPNQPRRVKLPVVSGNDPSIEKQLADQAS